MTCLTLFSLFLFLVSDFSQAVDVSVNETDYETTQSTTTIDSDALSSTFTNSPCSGGPQAEDENAQAMHDQRRKTETQDTADPVCQSTCSITGVILSSIKEDLSRATDFRRKCRFRIILESLLKSWEEVKSPKAYFAISFLSTSLILALSTDIYPSQVVKGTALTELDALQKNVLADSRENGESLSLSENKFDAKYWSPFGINEQDLLIHLMKVGADRIPKLLMERRSKIGSVDGGGERGEFKKELSAQPEHIFYSVFQAPTSLPPDEVAMRVISQLHTLELETCKKRKEAIPLN